MKKMMCVSLALSLFMLLLPLGVLGEKVEEKVIEAVAPLSGEESFHLLIKESGEIKKITAEDYIFGVVAAEMPALYSEEALKAQAVAAYTYTLYKKEQNKTLDYDITDDFTTDQCYKTKEKALADWGEKGEEYATKIEKAIKSVKGEYLIYENKPILSVYHAVSSGQTYSAKEIWGKDIPYLQSAQSEEDRLAENFTDTKNFTVEELKEKLSVSEILVGEIKKTENGVVKTVEIGGEKINGTQIRSELSLKSTNFTVTQTENGLTFTTVGYGHGVGMSQKGADNLAKLGFSYKEILFHFYKGATLKC